MKLTLEGCRERQKNLLSILEEKKLDGAILSRRDHVNYFTSWLHDRHYAAAVFLQADGSATLVAAGEPDKVAADRIVPYEASRLATMHSLQFEEVALTLAPFIPANGRFGADLGGGIAGIGVLAGRSGQTVTDLTDELRRLRKRKHPDEVDAIRSAIAITDVMYRAAREAIAHGVDEIHVFNQIRSAAVEFAGEDLEHFGNDFRANEPGGPPRRRPMEAGELYILDAGPSLHGYFADNCRTFCVGGAPSDEQIAAWKRIDSLFPILEQAVSPGVPAAEVFEIANSHLSEGGYNGLIHHLGHGIGLAPHESPELNPRFDAVFEVGDLFTMEPGVYSPELKAGIRLEENYLLTEQGLEQLTSYPREL